MPFEQWVLFSLSLTASWVWLWVARRTYLNFASLDLLRLEPVGEFKAAEWPRISIVIPACNEGQTLEAAIGTLTALDYPSLEIILINDRSTDDTGSVMQRLAKVDKRIKALMIDSLPPGYLGKVHALKVALGHVTGDWILFTDADVHFSDDALKRAISYCCKNQLHHLSVFPEIRADGFWLRTVLRSSGLLFLLAFPPYRLKRPAQGANATAIGIGAFNLVNAAKLSETPGFDWLRMEIADDLGLALMLRRHGARSALLAGKGTVSLTWYPDLSSFMQGAINRSFSGFGYSYLKLTVGALFLLLYAFGPFLSLWVYVEPFRVLALGMAAASYISWLISEELLKRRTGLPGRINFLFSLGTCLALYGVIRSALLFTLHGGISWRGTFYSMSELKELQRVKL